MEMKLLSAFDINIQTLGTFVYLYSSPGQAGFGSYANIFLKTRWFASHLQRLPYLFSDIKDIFI